MKNIFISIIIPVFNNNDGLKKVLAGIQKQTYPKEKFEIIVVDNGSLISPRDIAQSHGAIYIEEHNYLNSPYSARNRGLEIAKGNVIALLDATCTPAPKWLEYGVLMIKKGSDLVGGNIIFNVTESSSTGEMYDSLINIKMKESILNRKVAKTGNLFIRRTVFDGIGKFPEGLRSGGDVRWTNLAVRNSFKLSFSENAAVFIEPRSLMPLIKKQWRVSKGQPAIWFENDPDRSRYKLIIKKLLVLFSLPDKTQLADMIKRRGKPFMENHFFKIYICAYIISITMKMGNIKGLLFLKDSGVEK